MDDEDFWYWMTLSKPSYYWVAKSLGGNAEKGADRAMDELSQAAPFVIGLLIFGAIVYFLLKLLGLVP